MCFLVVIFFIIKHILYTIIYYFLLVCLLMFILLFSTVVVRKLYATSPMQTWGVGHPKSHGNRTAIISGIFVASNVWERYSVRIHSMQRKFGRIEGIAHAFTYRSI